MPPGNEAYIHPCAHYCSRLDRVISETVDRKEFPCDKCHEIEIVEGLLFCPECKRWFSILDEIPHLVRDELRLVERECELLEKYRDELPPEILETGKPFNLKECPIEYSDEDKKMLAEGEFWGDFFHAYVDTGDTSILDIRSRGTHPAYLNYGIIERDDMEQHRPWGPWHTHLGNFLFSPLEEVHHARGLDFGCGGGQFGLEAAYRGIDMTGFDISPRALEIAKKYARSRGLDTQYIYADADNLPFRKQVFSLLMCKDSLHHLTKPARAIRAVKPILEPDALVIVIEHTGVSPLARTIYDMFARRLVPRIQRRYKHVDIPDVLLRGAPNEDLGMDEVEGTLKQNFYIARERREWMLYSRLEQLFYYAFGKRRWLARLIGKTIYPFERALMMVAKPDHIGIIARHRM